MNDQEPEVPTQQVLFSDNFENQAFTAENWNIDNVWKRRDRFASSSLNGEPIGITMEVDGSANTSQALELKEQIDTTDYDTVIISWKWRIEDNWDKSDFMQFEINKNDTGWTKLQEVSDLQGLRRRNSSENEWKQESIQLDGSSLDSVQIRFSANVNRGGEDGYVDQVSIIGMNEGAATSSITETDAITGIKTISDPSTPNENEFTNKDTDSIIDTNTSPDDDDLTSKSSIEESTPKSDPDHTTNQRTNENEGAATSSITETDAITGIKTISDTSTPSENEFTNKDTDSIINTNTSHDDDLISKSSIEESTPKSEPDQTTSEAEVFSNTDNSSSLLSTNDATLELIKTEYPSSTASLMDSVGLSTNTSELETTI